MKCQKLLKTLGEALMSYLIQNSSGKLEVYARKMGQNDLLLMCEEFHFKNIIYENKIFIRK
jgi:hypothetical protein